MFQDEGRALPRIVREQVALVVSGNQPLQLLPRGTSRNPRAHGNRQEISRKLALDYESAPVEPNVKALFRFADKLSRHPADVEKADVGELRNTVGTTTQSLKQLWSHPSTPAQTDSLQGLDWSQTSELR